MARTFVVSGSRAGIGSVVVSDSGSTKTTMVSNVGAEYDVAVNAGTFAFVSGVSSTAAVGSPTPKTPFTQWDSATKVTTTLTNNNLTATANASGGGVRAVDPQVSGKYYWEYTCGATFAGPATGLGLCNAAAILNTMGNNSFNAVMVYKAGSIVVNNVNTGTSIGTFTTSSVVCIAVDLGAKLIWVRVGAAGSWNATSGSANDPATGVGGKDISSIAAPYQNLYPGIGFASSGDIVTANFGASAFSGTVPSGFTSGWSSNLSPTNNLVATQIGSSAWVTNTHAPFWVTQVGASVWVDNKAIAVYPLGVAGTGSAGTVTGQVTIPGIDIPLTGVASSANVGIPTIADSSNVSLTGLQSIGQLGDVAFHIDSTVSVTGVASPGLAGGAIPNVATTIPGVAISTAIGTPTVEVTFIDGQQANTHIGTPVAAVTVAVIVVGLGTVAHQGDLLTFVTTGTNIRPVGVSATASIGTPSFTKSVALTGVSATAAITAPQVLGYNGGLMLDNLTVDQTHIQDVDAMVSLRWSDTEGQSWSDPVHRSLGLTGDYLTSLQWQRLGMARRGRVFEIEWSSPVATCLLGATVRYNAARS